MSMTCFQNEGAVNVVSMKPLMEADTSRPHGEHQQAGRQRKNAEVFPHWQWSAAAQGLKALKDGWDPWQPVFKKRGFFLRVMQKLD